VPNRADFETLNALIAEAVALCEEAQEQFQRIHADILKTVEKGQALTRSMINEDHRARARLFVARTRLSRRRSRLR
jgi:hypothetical protein